MSKISTVQRAPSVVALILSSAAASQSLPLKDAYGRALTRDTYLLTQLGAPTVVHSKSNGSDWSLAPYVARPSGSWPYSVDIGDVTGDGLPDVVVATTSFFSQPTNHSVFLFPQDASGALQSPTYTPYLQSPNRAGLALAQLDGENGLDVVVGGSGLSVLLSRPDGQLGPASFYIGEDAVTIDLIDVDEDGVLDLASTTYGYGGHVHFSQGDGTFLTSQWNATLQGADSTATGDLDGDGDVDLVIASGAGDQPNIRLYRNNGNGSLDDEIGAFVASCAGWRSRGVGIGDLNNDDLADIVVSAGGNHPGSCLLVFYGEGNNVFSAPVNITSYDIPETLRVADMNGDGLDDVVVVHGGWESLGVYLQGQNGLLLPEVLYPLPFASHYSVEGLQIGDINSDGCLDVAIADHNNGLVTLLGQNCRLPSFRDGFE